MTPGLLVRQQAKVTLVGPTRVLRARGDTVMGRRTRGIGPFRTIRGLTGQHSVREGQMWFCRFETLPKPILCTQ